MPLSSAVRTYRGPDRTLTFKRAIPDSKIDATLDLVIALSQ
jgi:hypothetical protein